jgi:hypothetical protein
MRHLRHSDTEEDFFIWIRCKPLKRPNSAKVIQGNPSFFPWIYLHLLALIEQILRTVDLLAQDRRGAADRDDLARVSALAGGRPLPLSPGARLGADQFADPV